MGQVTAKPGVPETYRDLFLIARSITTAPGDGITCNASHNSNIQHHQPGPLAPGLAINWGKGQSSVALLTNDGLPQVQPD